MAEGAWIFLSHSHQDYDRVAQVRNYLEQLGHHPLMFFLKCLSDDHEVDGLIRREIEARSWFVLCSSANSKNSSWVKSEVEIIKALSEKTYSEIDLDDANLDLDSKLFALVHKATVFLSFNHNDEEVARKIQETLKAHDFGVFSDLDLRGSEDWQKRTNEELESAARRGTVLFLLGARSLDSIFQQRELADALRIATTQGRRGHILPIYLEGFRALRDAPPHIYEQLARINGLDLSIGDFRANMDTLMKRLRRYEWQPE